MPFPNLARAAFSQGSTLVRVRSFTGAYVAGRWQPAFQSDRFVRAAVRPYRAKDRQLFPEGKRETDAISLLVMPGDRLRIESSIEDGGVAPDWVLWSGWWFKAVTEKDWVENGFIRHTCERIEKWREDA